MESKIELEWCGWGRGLRDQKLVLHCSIAVAKIKLHIWKIWANFELLLLLVSCYCCKQWVNGSVWMEMKIFTGFSDSISNKMLGVERGGRLCWNIYSHWQTNSITVGGQIYFIKETIRTQIELFQLKPSGNLFYDQCILINFWIKLINVFSRGDYSSEFEHTDKVLILWQYESKYK